MRKIVGRPNLSVIPDLPLPIHVRSAGYNEAAPGWEELADDKPFVQIFWCVQGTGEFILPDRQVILHPGETFYHLPGELHHHRSIDPVSPWHYYWFTFDGEHAVDFINSDGFGQQPRYGGSCPVELFMELEILVRRQTPFNQRYAIAKAAEIIARMGGNNEHLPAEDLVAAFLIAARENICDPDVTVERIADSLGVHRTTLNKHFKEKMKITPAVHLNMIRLQYALLLLKSTSSSIKEIAELAGFGSAGYFSKVVRKHTGQSPEEYRKK